MNTADLLVQSLVEEGVEYIFGIPGEENLEIIEALKKTDIRFITVRHEQGAAFMADVYGRLTGKAGVCLATLGPGATNLVTGVADADEDGAPLIAITGQVGTERMHLTSHQFLDLVKMFEPITKKSKQIVRPDTAAEIVRIAFKHAESEKPGACHIDLPVNIARMEVPDTERPLKKEERPIEFADLNPVKAAARLISEAKSPVVLIGSSAVRARAGEAITRFVTELKIPAVNTMMAKGVVAYDNPYCMWTVGIPQQDYANILIDRADLVIAIGYDLVEYAPNKWNHDPSRKIIHIDALPTDINKLYQPEVQVVGDISNSVRWLLDYVNRREVPVFDPKLKKRMEKEFSEHDNDDSFPMKPQRILSDIRKVLYPNDILVSDVGAHKMWIARQYHCYKPNTCIISNGFATMGIAVPGAVAAKLVYPERRVLAVTGDGGFLMNSQELETAFRIGTPIVVLVFDDSAYGLIKWKQMDRFGTSSCVDFGGIDYVKYAESFGGKGYRVERTQDLVPILQDAFAQTVPCIIDCPVDYAENVKLSRHLQRIRR